MEDHGAHHSESMRKGLDTLREYIAFLQEMESKYLDAAGVSHTTERRARRVIEAAFPDRVESHEEDC